MLVALLLKLLNSIIWFLVGVHSGGNGNLGGSVLLWLWFRFVRLGEIVLFA